MPETPSLPPVTLVIPTRGRPTQVVETVRSILAADQVPAEMIVVDQSDAPNAELAALVPDRPCAFHYRWSPIPGVSRARNEGMKAASHEIIVLTDDDVLVTPTWLADLVGALLRFGPRSIVTGRVMPGLTREGAGHVPSTRVDLEPAVYEGRIYADVFYTNNLALYKSAAAEVGWFDERLGGGTGFPSAEDNDLGFRLLEAGYRIHYVPEAVLYHVAWRSDDQILGVYWDYARAQGGYYAKYLSLSDRYMLGRLIAEVKRYGRTYARIVVRERRLKDRSGIWAFGMLVGAGKWVLSHSWRRSSPHSSIGAPPAAALPPRRG